MHKRDFLKNIALLGTGATGLFKDLDKWTAGVEGLSPAQVATNEDFWANVRSGYRLKPDYINLENGYYCIVPQETLENHIHHIREINYQGAYYMRTSQTDNKWAVQEKLAELAGCTAGEIGITRNTTESLDLVIAGFPWEKGDEAIVAEQDYGAMLNMFDLTAKRQGITIKRVSVPLHPKDDQEIVDLYAAAITPRTKLLMVCHIINITGQILPVRKICDMAHQKGVEVMVDGAHAFGHFQFNIKELDCDYYGASLHKWLSAPLGAGILYVKKEKTTKIWPLLAPWDKGATDIRRLNHTGTHPVHTDLAIGNALEYLYKLGPARKEERLRYLQNYWTDKVREQPRIILNTPKDRQRSCAIANVGVKGMTPHDMAKTLLEKYRIYTVAIDGAGVQGCRITPNVYTMVKELDKFVRALEELSNG